MFHERRRRKRIPATPRSARGPLGVVFALTLSASAILGSQVRPVNLEEMTARAARIFSGRCVRVVPAEDPVLGGPVLLATFAVEHLVKGEPAREVTVKLVAGRSAIEGGGAAAGPDVAGVPAFVEGEEVVLFLYGQSALGFSNTVGLGQGKFRILRNKQGDRIALNAFSNEGLFRGLSAEAKGRLGEAVERREGRQGIGPTELLAIVESLVARSRPPGSGPHDPGGKP